MKVELSLDEIRFLAELVEGYFHKHLGRIDHGASDLWRKLDSILQENETP